MAQALAAVAVVALAAALVVLAAPFDHVPYFAPTYHQHPHRTDGYPGGKKRG